MTKAQMPRHNQVSLRSNHDAWRRAKPPADCLKLTVTLAAEFLALCTLAANAHAAPAPPQDATAASSTVPAATVVLPPRIVAGQPTTLSVLDSDGALRA